MTLPAGFDLENADFPIEGSDLVLVLADGSELVITGGAAHIPTFIIGDVELPQATVVAALESSNINVAEGPDGYSASVRAPDSSADFDDSAISATPKTSPWRRCWKAPPLQTTSPQKGPPSLTTAAHPSFL